MKKMTIEKAKAELHAVMSGPAGKQWNYGPAVSAVLAALEQAEQRIAELEARKLVPVMYKGMELLKNDGLELIRDGLAEATELESMCMAGALLSAPPAANYNLFVQGVIDDGENCAYADDDEAQYFTVYRRNADGTADALMDFTNRVNALWAISLVKKLNKLPESNS